MIRDLLRWLRPWEDFSNVGPQTRLVEELALTSQDGLCLVAAIEARCGRTFLWDEALVTVGDLLAYLLRQGVACE